MSLLVTGSIGIDSVETPHGRAEGVLGGSSVYFSLAASLFTEVRLVGVVGEDFDMEMLRPLAERPIDTRGVEVRPGSKTFRWHGKYTGAMNTAETLDVKLNVLAEHGAEIPAEFADTDYIFLANTHPGLQRGFARQFPNAKLIVSDTMDIWIRNEPDELRRLLSVVHGLVLNENEARLLTGQGNLVTAGLEILKMGPRFTVIKKGEHGSLLVAHDDLCVLPAYPTLKTIDPTGCGDTFAGAMMGYLAAQDRHDPGVLRSAMARGSVVSSFVIESFSVGALTEVTAEDIQRRLERLQAIAKFE
jgi:sugar/nucleoside kinase (ribokinase family)